MPEPVPLRKSKSRAKTPAAAYLIGHGPLREPRLIELQHLRIRRYLKLLSEHEGREFELVGTHVDINYPRAQPEQDRRPDLLPQLFELFERIASGEVRAVFVDYAPAEGALDYFRPEYFTERGAEVLNAAEHGDLLFGHEVSARVGDPRRPWYMFPSTAEDLLTFFPGLAAWSVREILRMAPEPRDRTDLERRLGELAHENPYAFGKEPFLSPGRQQAIAATLMSRPPAQPSVSPKPINSPEDDQSEE